MSVPKGVIPLFSRYGLEINAINNGEDPVFVEINAFGDVVATISSLELNERSVVELIIFNDAEGNDIYEFYDEQS